MTAENAENQVKKSFLKSWKSLKFRSKLYQIFVHLFALAALAIIGAWGFYQLGFANDKGRVDENNRYLADYTNNLVETDSSKIFEDQMQACLNLVAVSKFYPLNAHLMLDAARYSDRQDVMERMLYAANMYLEEGESGEPYRRLLKELDAVLDKCPTVRDTANLIPWMNEQAWPSLKAAILKDRAAIEEAARLTGVEPRLIVGCLVGEQIRLFNSKREMYKQYLGPVKVLSVQSQFSFGVNGIKDFTARQVEQHLKDTASVFYMGKAYEHILDFDTGDHTTERYRRLTNYHDHLYSYIYTGCILRQTMLQWKRSGYDISDRPDILFTLFNLGFGASNPNDNPQCGGSRIEANGRTYTFGRIGSDFYYSGEMAKEFPIHSQSFVND